MYTLVADSFNGKLIHPEPFTGILQFPIGAWGGHRSVGRVLIRPKLLVV